MKLEIRKPLDYAVVERCIDDRDWAVEDLLYHAVACLDVILSTMEPDVRHDVLTLIRSRYGLRLS